jgi:cholesterol transport system auxiliary component
MKYRIRNTRVVALCAAGLAFATSACALTSKAAIVDVRYFSPERVELRTKKSEEPRLAPSVTAPDGPLQLRLGRVSSGPNLRERIAYRDSAYELGYYEDLRWTERPETYVRRELGRSLFEVHGIHRVLSGAGPTLDVEVIAFDELRLKEGRAAQVRLKAILYDDSDVMFEDTLTIDRPVAGEKPQIEDVIAAMATALDSASDQVTLKVQKALAARRLAAPMDSAP